MKRISRRARPHTVTLYNYVSTTGGMATYQRTVLERVQLGRGYRQRLQQQGITTEDEALLVLDLRDTTATSGRIFVTPEAWHGLNAQGRAASFTFQPDKDFFVAGVVYDALPAETKATMQAKYRCYAVTALSLPESAAAVPEVLEVTAR